MRRHQDLLDDMQLNKWQVLFATETHIRPNVTSPTFALAGEEDGYMVITSGVTEENSSDTQGSTSTSSNSQTEHACGQQHGSAWVPGAAIVLHPALYKHWLDAGAVRDAPSDRLVAITLPAQAIFDFNHMRGMGRFKTLVLISAYAPIKAKQDQAGIFYNDLNQLLLRIEREHRDAAIIVGGDFNARIQAGMGARGLGAGPHSGYLSSCKNGERLTALCRVRRLGITDTFFRHGPSQRNTFLSARYRTRGLQTRHAWSQHGRCIDHFLTSPVLLQRGLVTDVRVRCTTTKTTSDHRPQVMALCRSRARVTWTRSRPAKPSDVVDLRRWKNESAPKEARIAYQQSFARLSEGQGIAQDLTTRLDMLHGCALEGYERYMCLDITRRRKKSKLSLEAQQAVRERNVLHTRACKIDNRLERRPYIVLEPKEMRPHWMEWKKQAERARQLVMRDKRIRKMDQVERLDEAGKAKGGNGEAWEIMREMDREFHEKPKPAIQLKDAQGQKIVDCEGAMKAHFEAMTNLPTPEEIPVIRPTPKPMAPHLDELPPPKPFHQEKERQELEQMETEAAERREQVVVAALAAATGTGTGEGRQQLRFETHEVRRAIRKCKNKRAMDAHGMAAELIKEGGEEVVNVLTALFNDVAATGTIPEQWKYTKFVPLYKGKGSKALVENYRPIAIVPITYKIFTYILLNRIRRKIESQLLDEQRGFLFNRGVRDAISVVKRLEQECRRTGTRAYITYIDIAKAYDSVPRQLLFHVLRHYGLEEEMVAMLQLLYTDTKGQVVMNGTTSESFTITSGVKQGCILSPLLFNVYLDCVVRQCVEELRKDGVDWEYPEDFLRSLNRTDKELDQMRDTDLHYLERYHQAQQEHLRLQHHQQQQRMRQLVTWQQQQLGWRQMYQTWWIQRQMWELQRRQLLGQVWQQLLWWQQLLRWQRGQHQLARQQLWWQHMFWWSGQQQQQWQQQHQLVQQQQQEQEQQQQLHLQRQREQLPEEEEEGGEMASRRHMRWYKKKLSMAIYADDKALIAATPAGQQRQVNVLATTTAVWGLKISVKKTVVMVVGQGSEEERQATVVLDGERLKQVSQFKYLGHIITDSGDEMPQLKERVSRAFNRLMIYDMIFRQVGLSWKTKGKFLKVGVLSTLFQDIELCCLTQKEFQYLLDAYKKLMARALNLAPGWKGQRLSKEEMAHRLRLPSLLAYIQKRQLHYIGTMSRMHDEQPTLPTMALVGRRAGQYSEGDHPGPPTWRKVIKPALREAVGDDVCSDRLARDQAAWEDRELAPIRRDLAERARCEECGRHYSQRGLVAHMRARHGQQPQQELQEQQEE